jgi:hypothetical protein
MASQLTDSQITDIVLGTEPAPNVLSDNRTAAEKFSDRQWRLDNLYCIRDADGNKIRFRMNVSQQDLLDNVWYMNLILKARQLGFTTFVCILFLDVCLFNSNVRAGIVAHNREDAQEFFEDKVAFAYDNLPDSLRAARTADTDRANKLALNNGSSIRVGTSLRSGTLQYLHVSEFGKICAKYPEKAREIVTGALNTVHAGQYVFVESTAEGREGYFFDFVSEAEKRQLSGIKPNPMQFKLHFYPWWKCPTYTTDPRGVSIPSRLQDYFHELATKEGIHLTAGQKAWYVMKEETQEEDMFREYPSTPGEAFKASVEGAYFKTQMAKLRGGRRITTVPYVPGIPVNTGWDLGRNDENVLWFHQYVAREHRLIDYYENSGEDLAHYVKVMQERGYTYGNHYLPHDAKQRRVQSESVEDLLCDMGLKNIVVVPKTEDLVLSIDETRRFLSLCWIDAEKCDRGITCLDSYRKEWNIKTGSFINHPLHNWASNGADGLRSLACGYGIQPPGSEPEEDWRATRRPASYRRSH